MKLSTLVFLMLISNGVYGQKNKNAEIKNCLEVAKELSYYWRLDSLGGNGFRLYTYQKFLDSKPDVLYADVLLNKLGKPNEVRKTNKGTEYIYYYFDIKAMPKNYEAPQACWYVSFNFDKDKHILSSIDKGDIDR